MTVRLSVVAAPFNLLGFGYSAPVNAIGCITGGAAGAVAGHMAHHGILGAAGGCIAGHEYHKHQEHEKQLRSQQGYSPQSPGSQQDGPKEQNN
jgi:hypothetical protein